MKARSRGQTVSGQQQVCEAFLALFSDEDLCPYFSGLSNASHHGLTLRAFYVVMIFGISVYHISSWIWRTDIFLAVAAFLTMMAYASEAIAKVMFADDASMKRCTDRKRRRNKVKPCHQQLTQHKLRTVQTLNAAMSELPQLMDPRSQAPWWVLCMFMAAFAGLKFVTVLLVGVLDLDEIARFSRDCADELCCALARSH